MFNVTVLKMKDIKKYAFGMLVTIVAIIIGSKYFPQITKEKKIEQIVLKRSMVESLDQAVPTISAINQENKNIEENSKEITEDEFLQGILKTQVSSIQGIENIEEKERIAQEKQKEKEEQEKQNNEQVEVAQTGLETEVITNNPLKENYNAQYHNVKIKNETEYQLTEEMLNPDITIENKNIVLFHTHSCESYTASEAYPYTPTGNFRTTDLNFTVTKVGAELETRLKELNYNVVHDSSYHDYPAYNGSYTRSLATVEKILQTTPADIVMDVHRDAIGSRSDYAPTVKIGQEDVAAQIMFVIRNG